MPSANSRLLLGIFAICLTFMVVSGETVVNPEEVTPSGLTVESVTQVDVVEGEKQGDFSTERNCIVSGRACELLVQRRLCCSGNPCQIVPSQILQLFTLGGWGMCH